MCVCLCVFVFLSHPKQFGTTSEKQLYGRGPQRFICRISLVARNRVESRTCFVRPDAALGGRGATPVAEGGRVREPGQRTTARTFKPSSTGRWTGEGQADVTEVRGADVTERFFTRIGESKRLNRMALATAVYRKNGVTVLQMPRICHLQVVVALLPRALPGYLRRKVPLQHFAYMS